MGDGDAVEVDEGEAALDAVKVDADALPEESGVDQVEVYEGEA